MGESEGTTHYDVLGVAPDASATDIRRAFQRLTLVHHPDRNRNDPSAGARMAEINAAYRVLRDRQKRREYDASLPSQTRDAAEDVADDPFRDARTHWERADPEQREWREYVREVRAELRGWADSRLQAFVLSQGVLVSNAASSEERRMRQWFVDAALGELESRRKNAEREHAEREQRRQTEREMHRRAARERAEQAEREQRERDAAERERAERERRRREEQQRAEQAKREQREAPPQPHDGAGTPPAEERRPEGRDWRIVRRLAARVGVAVVVLMAHGIAIALSAGTNPNNPEVASDGAGIAGIIWLVCAVLALVFAGADAFGNVTEVWRKRSIGVFAVLVVLSIVISAVVG